LNTVHIAWGSLGEIFLVSFGAAVGVMVLFSLGVTVLAPHPQNVPAQVREVPPAARHAIAALCFLACALVVGYGLYLIIAK
jgi:hypothetical protein